MPEQLNMEELRGVLVEEIHKIRDGNATAANVQAITNAVGKILSTIKLEMEYCRLVGRTPNIPLLTAPASAVSEARPISGPGDGD